MGSESKLATAPRLKVVAFGEFAEKAFELDDDYAWELGLDERGRTILVPLKLRT